MVMWAASVEYFVHFTVIVTFSSSTVVFSISAFDCNVEFVDQSRKSRIWRENYFFPSLCSLNSEQENF